MFESIRWILDNIFGISGNSFGQHFTVNFTLNGKRDRAKEKFNCHVGCVAWPFGKIKIATPLIKD